MRRSIASGVAVAAAFVSVASAAEAIPETLNAMSTVNFVETPLQDVVKSLSARHKISIACDEAAFRKAGLRTDEPVTLVVTVKPISLRSALNLITSQHRLEYRVDGSGLLIVPETPDDQKPPADPGPGFASSPRVVYLKRMLQVPTTFEFFETPMADVFKKLSQMHDIPFVFDEREMKKRMYKGVRPITIRQNAPNFPISEALVRLLEPHALEAVIENEVLFITPSNWPAALEPAR